MWLHRLFASFVGEVHTMDLALLPPPLLAGGYAEKKNNVWSLHLFYGYISPTIHVLMAKMHVYSSTFAHQWMVVVVMLL